MINGLLTEAARPHWAAAARNRLTIPSCGTCGHLFWPPARICPHCLDQDIVWRDIPPTGMITAAATFHRPYHDVPWLTVPYIVVLVTLDAGPSMFSNLIGGEAAIGARVTAHFHPVGPDEAIVQFTPTDFDA